MNCILKIKKNNKNSLCILLNGKKYEVNSQWLYEHSDNAEIRDPYTKQLLIEAAEISPSLKIIDAQIEKETLAITFSDNSQHNYKIDYIYSQLKKAPVSDDKYLWNKKNLKVPKYNFKNINRIRKDGLTVLVVEQNVRMALLLADYGYVIKDGVINVEGESKKLMYDESVKESYLGGTKANV